MKLSNATLASLPGTLARPTYDRAGLTAGIVHVGMGHFHRAHQALYLDDLLNKGLARDWAIAGTGMFPGAPDGGRALRDQDGLYTLTEKQADGETSSKVIGSVIDYHHATEDREAVVARIADPQTRMLTLTITEGAYDIEGADPRGVFGVVAEAMAARRGAGHGGLSIVSCDNIQGNGAVAKAAFIAYAEQVDPKLAAWMEAHVMFPNSMVDRVTPRTVDADRADLRARFGLEDAWPVTAEPFRQWVIEDAFAAGRPPLEEAGVEVVTDVMPYELMKLRLANGTHQALAYFGVLLGHTFVHEAIADPAINALLLRYIDEEAAPTLSPIPGYDFGSYGRTVLGRFGNPQIRDGLDRICEDTSDRIPKFLLPGVFDNLDAGRSVGISAAVVASWARYAEGVDEQGNALDVRDPLAADLTARAQHNRQDPTAFLGNRTVFGNLIDRPEFTEPYVRALRTLHEGGAMALLDGLR